MFFSVKGAIYYVARATVIFHVWRYITCLYFSHVKISCFRANAYPVFKWWLYNILINSILISMDSWHKQLMNRHIQIKGGSRIFFRRGCTRLLLYFNTNKPHSFFWQNTSCIRKPQVISGGGGVRTSSTLPLDPPPLSQFETINDFHLLNFFVWKPQPFMNFSH